MEEMKVITLVLIAAIGLVASLNAPIIPTAEVETVYETVWEEETLVVTFTVDELIERGADYLSGWGASGRASELTMVTIEDGPFSTKWVNVTRWVRNRESIPIVATISLTVYNVTTACRQDLGLLYGAASCTGFLDDEGQNIKFNWTVSATVTIPSRIVQEVPTSHERWFRLTAQVFGIEADPVIEHWIEVEPIAEVIQVERQVEKAIAMPRLVEKNETKEVRYSVLDLLLRGG